MPARYELLNLGRDEQLQTAPARSTSHLQVGDTAIVVSDPDPVRARASAPDGQVVGTLYKNYQLPITGGPVCANGILWWEVTLRDSTRPGSPRALAMVIQRTLPRPENGGRANAGRASRRRTAKR